MGKAKRKVKSSNETATGWANYFKQKKNLKARQEYEEIIKGKSRVFYNDIKNLKQRAPLIIITGVRLVASL